MNRSKKPGSRRLFSLLCILALAVSLLCGCSSTGGKIVIREKEPDEADSVVLTVFGFKADALNLTAIEDALHGFMDENPDISVVYEGIKGAAYYDVLDKRAASASMDDISMADHDSILEMEAQGLLADLSDLPELANYTEQARSQFTGDDGSVYFLPTCISTYNLYINYDLLEAHGQSIPTNWEELRQVCDYFVSQGITPVIANNYASLPTLITSRALFDTYQLADVDAAMEAFNEDPEALADALVPGVEMVADMIARGWLDAEEVLATEQTSDDLELFLEGGRPFMVTGGWASVRVIAAEPGFTYGVYPYPILDDGSVLSMQVDTCIVVSAQSSHLEQTKKLVSYLLRPDVMWEYCDSQASYTPLREETRVPSEKTLVPSTEYLTNGRSVMRSDYRLSLPLSQALADCADTLLRGGTAEQARAALLNGLTAEVSPQ